MIPNLRHMLRSQVTSAMLYTGALLLSSTPVVGQTGDDYVLTRDVVYGEAVVTRDGTEVSRPLWMDVYEPVGASSTPRPAVVMTFGGAFHRGSPRTTFHEDGAQDTSMGDYCRKFAVRGYVCFAIDYRLTPEGPIPSRVGYSDADLDRSSLGILLDQVNLVRASMELDVIDLDDPQSAKLLEDAVLSAAEDVRTAVDHVRGSSTEYNVDPNRIVLGGFSAGAITTLNVVHGMHVPVAGAFLLSGANTGFDIQRSVTTSSNSPPVLLFLGQHDLAGAFVAIPSLLAHYESVGVQYQLAWVAGFGHFYPSGATSLASDGTRVSVEERIVRFLQVTIGGPASR